MSDKKVRWGAIVTEKDTSREGAYKLSLGRSMGWIMFILLMVLWSTGSVVPDTLIVIFLTITGYNLGSKITPTLNTLIEKKMGPKEDA